MYIWVVVKVALRSLIANKLRSILAMLGIIIGVGAVISMLSIGTGAQKQVLDRVSAMGTNLLVVRPGAARQGGVNTGDRQNLKIEDARALLTASPQIDAIAPVVSGNFQAKYMNMNSRTSLTGTTITYFAIRNMAVEKGRMFSMNESESLTRVAIIGPTTAENLFGQNDPLEEQIKINGINFTVIGILKSKGDQGFANPDDQIIIPYKTAMKQLIGADSLREIDIHVIEGGDLTKVQESATAVLRKQHKLLADDPDDFNVRNQAEILETANSITQTFTILLGGIASISLLVGGIGIMNIMLVTVTERTREIGIRKAIGAKEKDILRQFLIEAIVMTSLGGLIGMAGGISIASIISIFTPFKAVVQPSSVIISMVFSIGVGIFFGYYPAKRAAKMDPIEALRYE
jgi:putative ABC transport system permease protein